MDRLFDQTRDRAATIVVGYLVSIGYKLLPTYFYLCGKMPGVLLNKGFRRQLIQYEKTVTDLLLKIDP